MAKPRLRAWDSAGSGPEDAVSKIPAEVPLPPAMPQAAAGRGHLPTSARGHSHTPPGSPTQGAVAGANGLAGVGSTDHSEGSGLAGVGSGTQCDFSSSSCTGA